MTTTVELEIRAMHGFIASATDAHQMNYIYKRIQNHTALSKEDRAALDEAWRKRFSALMPRGTGKPRWAQNNLF